MTAAQASTRHVTGVGYRPMVLLAYLLLWTVTLIAAVATRALGFADPVKALLGLRLSPAATVAPTLPAVAALAAHNLAVCGWPLLLPAASASDGPKRTLAGHALVCASLTVNAALVGAAFGAYGGRLLAYVPQLPVEWLALAAGAAGWFSLPARSDAGTRVRAGALVLAAVLAAAVGETYAVPHSARGSSGSSDPFGGGVKTPRRSTYQRSPKFEHEEGR